MSSAHADAHPALPKIFVFCRGYLVGDFRRNLEVVAGEYDFDFMADGKAPGTADTRARFYAALKAGEETDLLSTDDFEDIIERCRLLRNIDPAQAKRLIHAMTVTISEALDRSNPDAVLSHMVDEYVLSILSLLAKKRGIEFVGYAYSYFPNRAQITRFANGQPQIFREPDDAEVEKVFGEISQRVFRQNYLQPAAYTRFQHVKYMARHHIKRIAFWLRGLIERDPWNVHYAITPYIVDRRRLSDYPTRAQFCEDWTAKLLAEKARRPGSPVVYIPLGYFPESTIDFWIADRRILKYQEVMLDLARTVGKDCIVVVKEHLHMLGARDPAFYNALAGVENVISVHPSEFSNDVLDASDVVLLGAGSVGVEAPIRAKPVVSYCTTSYWFAASRAVAVDLGELDQCSGQIRRAIAGYQPMTESEKRDFIRKCLQSTARPRGKGTRWPLIEQDDLRKILNTALNPR
jgi:hypothetical protein